ncbi:hypothetical protein BDN67DRAFT_1010120 [Paxillus ammoniavirescens]|nr:hypothetical protein BDN67DRAFT_1010120 [Paxillus ammoniavirescens]
MSIASSSVIVDQVFNAEFHGKEVMLISATLLFYDHAINLGEEIELMWTTRWSLSQVLYLTIRALGLVAVIFLAICEKSTFPACALLISKLQMSKLRRKLGSSRDELTHSEFGTRTVNIALTLLILSIVSTTLCQAVITLRVWYLFSDRPAIQYFAATAFVICAAASCSLSASMWEDMKGQIPGPTTTTLPAPSAKIAWIFVPALVIHSTLLALQIYRFVRSSNYMQRESLLWRFLKEGIFMYALSTLSLLFVIIGLCQTKPSELSTYWAALVGSLPMATSIISVCRAMLSIRSLAATSHVDVRWLLNHAELSRVQWKPGANGEIFVEVNEAAIELPSRPVTHGTTSSLE